MRLALLRRTVEDKYAGLEVAVLCREHPVNTQGLGVLLEGSVEFIIFEDILLSGAFLEAALEVDQVSSLALLRLFTSSPRTRNSRFFLGAVLFGLFMSSKAQLPVSARVDELDGVGRLVELEDDISLVVRSTLLTLLELPDAVLGRLAPRILLGLGVVQGEHPKAALCLGWHRRCRWIGFFLFFEKYLSPLEPGLRPPSTENIFEHFVLANCHWLSTGK